MDWKFYVTVFTTVFLAELGDKTQLAAMLFATDKQSNLILVFAASSLALICATGLAVLAGSLLGEHIDQTIIQRIAGVLFVGIGVLMLVR